MKKTLYHTDELFRLIDEKLQADGFRPSMLDYGLATLEHRPVKTISWDVIGRVNFGGSEGIYLDIYLEGDVGSKKTERVELGTYKTLLEDKEAFKAMSVLNAEFVFALREFVNAHMDDFNWIGYDIQFYKDGKRSTRYTTTRDLASAKSFIQEKIQTYRFDYADLIDNATGKEQRIQPVSTV